MRTIVPCLWITLAVAACEPAPPPAPPEPTPSVPVEAVPAAPVEVGKILAPSPLKLEAEVRAAGLTGALTVPATPADVATDDKDRVAVRTGVVLAYAVLGGRETPKDQFLAQLRSARAGMASLGAGEGLLSTIDASIKHVENDTASREDFLRELDDVVGFSVPEQGWGPDDRTGPLLQAGAWLAGTHVVAKAIVASDNAAAADKLLRRKDVADYFLGYVRSQGEVKAGPVAAQLEATLTRMSTIAAQPTIGVADAAAVAEATETLLGML